MAKKKLKMNWFTRMFFKLWYGGKGPIREYDFRQSTPNPWTKTCCKKKKELKKNKTKRSK